jgi:NAD(P)-dependent dehydrogenase (short-subunit alcohol dehydrogenase family)
MAPQYSGDDFKISSLYDVKDKGKLQHRPGLIIPSLTDFIVALVTGGGTGIGLMIVQALAINGAKVYITGRTSEKLEKVVELYGQNIAGQIIPITADVGQKSEIARLVQEIESKESCLCILVNNAGIEEGSHPVSESKNADEMRKNMFDDESNTFEEWTETYRTNVAGMYFLTTACLPLLQRSTETHKGYSGCVINITSISGLVRVTQHHPAYNASKAAAIHLSNMLGAEIADAGLKIRVNNIAPGTIPPPSP